MEMKNESNAVNGEMSINDHIERAKQLRSEAIVVFFRQVAYWIKVHTSKRASMDTDFSGYSAPGMHKHCH